MEFRDEYELEVNGTVYYVEVEGEKLVEDGHAETILHELSIFDENDEGVDSTDPVYQTIKLDALDREYELEAHSRDFDYYDDLY